MRAIAEKAEVALGNTYYYFRSKEHLIQGFYARTHAEHLVACETVLTSERDLRKRLLATVRAKLDTSQPYHRFSGILFASAADPESPLNPFSDESAKVREEATALYARVLDGSKVKVPEDLRAELPGLLWLYQMGLILFWIHDRSPGAGRSRVLADHTADIVARLVTLASHPILAPVRKRVLRLLTELRAAGGAVKAPESP